MTTVSLREARSSVVRERVLEGVADLLASGDDLTFAKVAKAAGVPERTVYRYFPTREVLLTAIFDWANQRIGFEGELPTDRDGVLELVRRAFPGFEEIAPVIRELLREPEGLVARLSRNEERRRAAMAVVRRDAPGLDRASSQRVAAAVQVLSAAATWQTLRDYWDMNGDEAAETAALAIELLLEGASARADRMSSSPARRQRTRKS